MRTKDADTITGFLAGALLVLALVIAFDAEASDRHKKDVEVKQHQGQHQKQTAKGGDAVSDATASNEGVNTSVEVGGDQVENNSSNVVLVPNNNTESCLRVWGIAWGKNGESGALGIPWRSKKCDFEQAADDAFAAGERELGWFWKCQNKNLHKRWLHRDDNLTRDEEKTLAINRCYNNATDFANAQQQEVEELLERLRATEAALDLERRHGEVCAESKERCEDRLFGSK